MVNIVSAGGGLRLVTGLSFFHIRSIRKCYKNARRELDDVITLFGKQEQELEKDRKDVEQGNQKLTEEEFKTFTENVAAILERLNLVVEDIQLKQHDDLKYSKTVLDDMGEIIRTQWEKLSDEQKKMLEEILREINDELTGKMGELRDEEKNFRVLLLDRHLLLQNVTFRSDESMLHRIRVDLKKEAKTAREESSLQKSVRSLLEKIEHANDKKGLEKEIADLKAEFQKEFELEKRDLPKVRQLIDYTMYFYRMEAAEQEKALQLLADIAQKGLDQKIVEEIKELFAKIEKGERAGLASDLAKVQTLESEDSHLVKEDEQEWHRAA